MLGINIFKQRSTGHLAGSATASLAYGQVKVLPCVINGIPHVIYPKGLKDTAPELFKKLSRYYIAKGYQLKEDQRTDNKRSKHYANRRRWAPMVLFTASLLFEGHALADTSHDTRSNAGQYSQQVALRIVPKQRLHLDVDSEIEDLGTANNDKHVKLKSAEARHVYSILKAHYLKRDTDPSYIENDFKKISNYYSQFPEVIALLDPLHDKNWQLSYDEDNWDTVASGNVLQIDKAVIHFDTRSAAQLLLNRKCTDNPVCIASPADALLHELLHTYSMFINTGKFVEDGGLNSVMYPYQHEYAVIDAERHLYASMSLHDNRKRPQRTEHTGRAVLAHCPICIK